MDNSHFLCFLHVRDARYDLAECAGACRAAQMIHGISTTSPVSFDNIDITSSVVSDLFFNTNET